MRALIVLMLLIVPFAGASNHAESPFEAGYRLDASPLSQVPMERFVEMAQENETLDDVIQEVLAAVESLYPVGDVDGDGIDDVLRYQYFDQDAGYRIYAVLRGGDFSEVWSKRFDDEYAYVVGDVDKDGVMDIAVSSSTTSGGRTDPVYDSLGYESAYEMTESIDVLSGRDASTMFSTTSQSSYYFGVISEGTPVGFAQSMRWEFTSEGLRAATGMPGLVVGTYGFRSTDNTAYVFAPALFSYVRASDDSYSSGQKMLDENGGLVYDQSPPGEGTSYLMDFVDVTGDGVPDLLFLDGPSNRYAAAYTPVAGESVFLPGDWTQRMVDGATGSELWQLDVNEQAIESLVTVAGDTHGTGMEVLQATFYQDVQGMFTVLTRLDAKTGAVKDESTYRDELLAYWQFDDVDQDGDDEVLLLRAPAEADLVGGIDDGELSIAIAQGDLSPVWMVGTDDEYWFEFLEPGEMPLDFNGDGVRDVVVWSDALHVWSGTDGSTLWSTEMDTIRDMNLIADIDGDGGWDLAFLRFDDRDANADEFADAVGRVELVRGADGQRIWQTKIWDPEHNDEATAANPYLAGGNIGDVNGNGVDDVLLDVYAYSFGEVVCDPNGCRIVEPDAPPMEVMWLVDGATAEALYSWRPLGLETRAPEIAQEVELGDAAQEIEALGASDDQESPGIAVVALMALLAALAVAYRTRK